MAKRTPLPVPVIISTIERSNIGKCVVVEGADDIVIYRSLITFYNDKGIKVLPAGGRLKVLEVFDIIKETEHLEKVIFIVDQDSWIFTGIPPDYQHPRIICTNGYSIENDVYIDRQLDSLMKGTNVFPAFQQELNTYLNWFALAITRFCTNNNANSEILDIHPEAFFKCVTTTQNYCNLQSGEIFPQNLYEDLLINYGLKFRGKCLLPLAIRALGRRSSEPKYNSNTIMEETAITGRGDNLNRIFDEVGRLA